QLMAQIDDSVQRAEYVEHILRQFEHMSSMTKEVLAFARGETNVLVRKVFMHKFLAELEAHLKHELTGKGVTLKVEAGYRGTAYFDEQKMLRLVHNIARNAVQAMPGGGLFRVTARTEGDRLVMEFADTGGGLPPEMEGRRFELFATSGKKEGTGLGLAIVKKIVDEHGGRISYETRRGPQGGTTFTVRLPLEKPLGLAATDETLIDPTPPPERTGTRDSGPRAAQAPRPDARARRGELLRRGGRGGGVPRSERRRQDDAAAPVRRLPPPRRGARARRRHRRRRPPARRPGAPRLPAGGRAAPRRPARRRLPAPSRALEARRPGQRRAHARAHRRRRRRAAAGAGAVARLPPARGARRRAPR